MGKASSAKKVTRLTKDRKAGKRSARSKYAFPAVLGGIFVAGVLGVVVVRAAQPSPFPRANTSGVAGQGGDHIHEVYGFNICGKWQTPIPEFDNQAGIHTHGDGVLHIHPFETSASGRKARLKVFLDGAHIRLTDRELAMPATSAAPAATVKVPGSCGGKPATLRVGEWKKATDKDQKPVRGGPDKIYKKDFGNIWLGHDGGGLTVFYGPPDARIPLPDYDKSIDYLIQAEGGNDTTVTPSSTTSVAPPTPGGPSSTVAPGAPR